MKRVAIFIFMLSLLLVQPAYAQLGDLLNRIRDGAVNHIQGRMAKELADACSAQARMSYLQGTEAAYDASFAFGPGHTQAIMVTMDQAGMLHTTQCMFHFNGYQTQIVALVIDNQRLR